MPLQVMVTLNGPGIRTSLSQYGGQSVLIHSHCSIYLSRTLFLPHPFLFYPFPLISLCHSFSFFLTLTLSYSVRFPLISLSLSLSCPLSLSHTQPFTVYPFPLTSLSFSFSLKIYSVCVFDAYWRTNTRQRYAGHKSIQAISQMKAM